MISWEQSINIKTPQEIEIMREAGRINAEALQAAVSLIEPGVTTAELNAAFEAVHRQYGVYSPFKNYPGPYPYPASICTSVNEELVHGIPGDRKLEEGDIVSIDCGTVYQGFVGDMAVTVGVGEISPDAQRLIKATEHALKLAIANLVTNNTIGDIGFAVQTYVENQGYHVTRMYTGHGVGRKMHEGPQVPNYGKPGWGIRLREGMTIALEPMVLVGTPDTVVKADQWTVASADGSLTAHFEHTVAVTADGPMILTLLNEN
ncbi:MAG: Methionine aminopeptidase 1 [Chloroflexi bacterium ADurb.Bin120]|jgi:methionyl aminopeptidase|uniref:Methionine aminopeptidase n=1 Tax=Candidatus Brevifilum fermentans TaxID=1986204 RepID=A0A1Y6K416_9CHLR|nr:type I methionyl aminopeptidase [Brevefilum fermentans]MDI9566385.1 type I methionyl aminopeptidase [Chloroflexota bacterium]OQB86538.1 MAG: Methionine aminopeptidase 1 [Chloroflexi bacterium ADurb.Bin120]SMX53608.1 Methionine aminopeptidase [Brevefilum fermentans]HOM67573.1 type I methionyl aminopeptidase [Brevefilum fermentans]